MLKRYNHGKLIAINKENFEYVFDMKVREKFNDNFPIS